MSSILERRDETRLDKRGHGISDPQTWCDACARAGEEDGSFLITGQGEGNACENSSHGTAQTFEDCDDQE